MLWAVPLNSMVFPLVLTPLLPGVKAPPMRTVSEGRLRDPLPLKVRLKYVPAGTDWLDEPAKVTVLLLPALTVPEAVTVPETERVAEVATVKVAPLPMVMLLQAPLPDTEGKNEVGQELFSY